MFNIEKSKLNNPITINAIPITKPVFSLTPDTIIRPAKRISNEFNIRVLGYRFTFSSSDASFFKTGTTLIISKIKRTTIAEKHNQKQIFIFLPSPNNLYKRTYR